jgi:hypothetical protein
MLLAAVPASAAPLQWSDPAGDAGFYLELEDPISVPIPTPNEPSLDVTGLRIEAKGANLVWTANVPGLAATNPSTSTGVSYTFGFSYGTADFTLAAVDDLGYGKATELRGGTLGQTNPTPCGKCAGLIDRKAHKIVFTTPIESLSRAFRTAVPGLKTFTTGSKLEKLSFTSARTYGVGTDNPAVRAAFREAFASDKSAPPTGATFTV